MAQYDDDDFDPFSDGNNWAGSNEVVLRTVCMDSVKPEVVRWLWKARIPRAKVTLLEGDPGLGKSTITADLAARISSGRAMPFDSECREPAAAIFISSEDGLGDTMLPRLAAADADLSRVHAIPLDELTCLPTFPSCADALETLIGKHGAELVVIDPLMAFFDEGIDTNKDSAVRQVMSSFTAVASRTGAAILVVRHLNKGVGKAAMYRGGGSIGIIGAARSALLIEKSPTNSDERIVARTKGNLSAPPKAIAFRLVTANDVARVEWLEESEVTADELLAANAEISAPKKQSKVEIAKRFLEGLLESGPVATLEVDELAEEAGISTTGALRRAAADLGVERTKGVGGHWFSSLPAHVAQVAHLAGPASGDGLNAADTTLSEEALLDESPWAWLMEGAGGAEQDEQGAHLGQGVHS